MLCARLSRASRSLAALRLRANQSSIIVEHRGTAFRSSFDRTGASPHAQTARTPFHEIPLMNAKRGFSVAGVPLEMSLSNLAGHGSFILLACSYLEPDVLSLRGYALSAIALSITFQYFRKQPLWIPISWNFLFLIINAGMIFLLLKERSDAENISDEAMSLYEDVFRKLGLSAVEYMHLMSCAEHRTLQRGEYFVRGNDVQTRLYIILEGKAEVCTGAGSYPVGDIREHQFVGALSFLNYLERASSSVKTDKSTPISNSSVNWVSSVDVRAAEPCVVLTWSFEQLAAIFKREPALANAFQGSISVDLKKKISHGWAGNTPPCERYRGMLQGALIDNELSVKEKEILNRYRSEHSINDETHRKILESMGWTADDYSRGYKFLQEGLEYEHLLREVLAQGNITDDGRKSLRKFRIQYGVDAREHLKALQRVGWSPDEFEIGIRNEKFMLDPEDNKVPTARNVIRAVTDGSLRCVSSATEPKRAMAMSRPAGDE